MKFNFWTSNPNRKPHPRLVLFGSGISGKTTLLCMWHTGRPVKTIPTIGFNLVQIRWGGRTVEVLDFGGCDRLAPMARHYLDSSTGVLFLHGLDASPGRAADSYELLAVHTQQVIDAGGRYVWVLLTRQDLVQESELDAKRVEAYKAVRDVLVQFGDKIEWRVFDDKGLNALDWVGMSRVFDTVAEKLVEHEKEKAGKGVVKQREKATKVMDEDELREKIRMNAKEDVSVEEFWDRFLTAELKDWNHWNHLRAGFMVLLKSAAMLEDFWVAVDTFLEHIQRLKRTRPDRFRNTTHRTMTMFWLYVLQLAIVKFRLQHRETRLPREDEFQEVMLLEPRLADSGYWEDYYSRSVMFTPEARQNWCLPDKKPLPVYSQMQRSTPLSSWRLPGFQKLDTERTGHGEEDIDGQMRLISFAVAVVQHYSNTGERRGKVVAEALASLERSTLQLRASNPSGLVEPYSETQAYFWIQIVHATLLPYQRDHTNQGDIGIDMRTSTRPISSGLTVSQLLHIFPVKSDLWKEYYSPKLWNAVNARMSFVNPDKRPLPNVFPKPPSPVVAERFMDIKGILGHGNENQDWDDDEKAMKELLNYVRSPIETELRITSILAEVDAFSKHNDEGILELERTAEGKRNSHANLLYVLFRSLQESTDRITGAVDVSLFTSLVLSHGSSPAGLNVIGSENSNRRIHSTDKTLSVANLAISENEDGNIPGMGVTRLLFYAHTVLVLSNNDIPRSAPQKGNLSLINFRTFLQAYPQLLWEELPFKFYRPETWSSLDAKVMFVSPDLRQLPGSIGGV